MLNIARSFTRTDVQVISGGSLLVGAATGYVIAKKRITSKIESRVEQDIEAVRDMYKRRYKEGEYAELEADSAVLIPEETTGGLDIAPVVPKTEYEQTVENLGYSQDDVVHAAYEGTVERRVPLAQVTVTVDPLAERHVEIVQERDPERPYVITREMFEDSEVGQEAVTFSWWEGDKTLSDEQEKIVTDVEGTVGRANLKEFGNGSEDERVVYIRNEKIGLDFEVIREPSKYSVEVAGDVPPETFERIRKPSRPSDDV